MAALGRSRSDGRPTVSSLTSTTSSFTKAMRSDSTDAFSRVSISTTASASGKAGDTEMDSSCSCPIRICCRSEEHTSELQSRLHLVCRLLLEKKKKNRNTNKDSNIEKYTSVH